MKKILAFFFIIGLAVTAAAIPAKREFMTVVNSDGTTFRVTLCGDETFHFYVTEDGTPVRQIDNGDWVIDKRDISSLWPKANARRNNHRVQLAEKARRAMKAPRRGGVVSDDETDIKKGLLILVNFQDVKFKNSDQKTKSIFDQMVNGIDNPYGRNKGSVREYFRAQSYNQFDIEFDVIGPVTVSKEMAYYGKNDTDGNDLHPEEMIIEAVKLVDEDVDFADYDWDGDGEVENIYVTYAGYGEATSGADPNTIWPHQWQLSEAGKKLVLDGVKIDTYACGSELKGKSGSTIEAIGTMCHEYSHCLGLPDFYDCTYSGYVDMSDWSLMAQGCDNNSGYTPCGYTSYERWFCGWLEPTVLNSPCNVKGIMPIEDEPEAYIIYNDKTKNEYYMLANHQKKGWDSAMQGHGMMILHVDYNRYAWEENVVNSTSNHPRMAIIPADNELKKVSIYYYADAGDLWPGTSHNTALTDTSTPAATLYNKNTDGKKFMHKNIEEITESSGKISFKFMGGAPAIKAPVALEATDIETTAFTANWEPSENAVSYELTLTETYDDGSGLEIHDAILLSEDFASFYVTDNNATTDGPNVKDELDEHTTVPGWTGDYVYEGLYGAKLGTTT